MDTSDDDLSEHSQGDKSTKTRWTKHEDAALKSLVEQYGERWDAIAKFLKDRTDIQCQQRWTKVVNPDLIKGPWTKEEKWACGKTRDQLYMTQQAHNCLKKTSLQPRSLNFYK